MFDSKEFDQRITRKVCDKLGVAVTLSHWHKLPTGAEVPVFIVPESHKQVAIKYGLTIA